MLKKISVAAVILGMGSLALASTHYAYFKNVDKSKTNPNLEIKFNIVGVNKQGHKVMDHGSFVLASGQKGNITVKPSAKKLKLYPNYAIVPVSVNGRAIPSSATPLNHSLHSCAIFATKNSGMNVNNSVNFSYHDGKYSCGRGGQ